MSGVIVLVLRVILSLCLYSFLGWAIYVVWRELQWNSTKYGPQTAPEISLLLPDSEQNNPVSFDRQEITIGREPACDFTISDDTVSSHHARLRFHHKQWWVEDLQSTNGTFLNEDRVYTPTVVVSGDELILGKMILEIHIQEKKA
jgi:pSer/pThr/pTyr-binding forkhead associated (FHA) protein